MDFTPDDEQRLIAESHARVFAAASPGETPGAVWATLHDLGLTRASWPEAQGGIGATMGDMVHVLIEAGRAATPEPLIGAALLPGLALSRAGDKAPDLPEGDLCLAVAWSGLRLEGERLDGTLPVVPGADMAGAVLVCLDDDRLAVANLDAPGVSRDSYTLVDGRGAADLRLDAVMPLAVGAPVPGLGAWLSDVVATAYAADALGAMLAARDMTLDYLKTRRQFGRPLGSFQALQHAMVDIHHDTEHFLSLAHLAARTCDGDDAALRMQAVSSAKLYLGGRMRRAAASAIQMQGGIGMTEEYALGRLVKRVLLADMLAGSADQHGARLARMIAEDTRKKDPAA